MIKANPRTKRNDFELITNQQRRGTSRTDCCSKLASSNIAVKIITRVTLIKTDFRKPVLFYRPAADGDK